MLGILFQSFGLFCLHKFKDMVWNKTSSWADVIWGRDEIVEYQEESVVCSEGLHYHRRDKSHESPSLKYISGAEHREGHHLEDL